MAEHKHAEVLRAIADGVPLSEFEVSKNEVFWAPLGEYQVSSINAYDIYIRRKPQYITVNGFKVPKPLDSLTFAQSYFVPVVSDGLPEACPRFNHNAELGKQHCARRIAHATKEAAIAHAKAMLGIDPEAQ